ncbi:MAG: F0F1 ATP synthase subunit delta [Pseudomonadota bacterium]
MTAASSITAGAAGRYATALFELASEAGSLDQTETDLVALGAAIEDSADLSSLLRDPIYSREQQGSAMAAICDKMGLSPLVKNVVGLMATKRRLFAVPELVTVFQALMAEHRGEITADVTAARPLSDTQANALVEQIKGAIGREVKLNVNVDEAIIGGLVVKVGSRMIDSSIRSRLANLQNAMKEVG